MSAYRAGLIGCGRIGYGFDLDPKRTGVWTHAGAYYAEDAVDFVGVCDTDTAKRQECAERFETRPYEALETLLDEDLDVVSVAVPETLHESVVERVLAHPKPPRIIWMEKPFTGKHATANRLCERARERGVHIHVNYLRRWCDLFRELQRYPDVLAVTVYYARGVLNTGSHFVDLILGLYGNPQTVHVISERAFSLRYENFVAQFLMVDPAYNICHTDIICRQHLLRVPPIPVSLQRQDAVPSKQYSEHLDLSDPVTVPLTFDPMLEQTHLFATCLQRNDFSALNNGLAVLNILDQVLA